MRWLLVLACVCGCGILVVGPDDGADPVTPLLRRFEQALNRGDRQALTGMFSPDVPTRAKSISYLGTLLMPGAVQDHAPVARSFAAGGGPAGRWL